MNMVDCPAAVRQDPAWLEQCHLHIAATHRGTRVLALIDDTTVTTIALDTGEILATHTINPHRNYWPNTQKEPGRWPSSS
jgi:hypothetical protein